MAHDEFNCVVAGPKPGDHSLGTMVANLLATIIPLLFLCGSVLVVQGDDLKDHVRLQNIRPEHFSGSIAQTGPI